LIAAVSNLDNLAAGVALGVRGTPIDLGRNVLIAAVTMVGTAGAITSGDFLARLLPLNVVGAVGALIIASIGIITLVASRAPRRQADAGMNRPLEPSETVSWREAALLATALSINNIGMGIGAGIAGIPPLMTTVLAGAFSLLCVGGGSHLGQLVGLLVGRHARLVAGLSLICLGGALLAGKG
jgi:putative Mn2+ efflux pump MntP